MRGAENVGCFGEDLGGRHLIARRPVSGVASVQIWIPAGSRSETAYPGSGAAHFVEHMVFKGTVRRNALEINRDAERMGGLLNAYTSYDRTVYHIDLPAKHAVEGINLLSDFVWNPLFPPEGFEPERDVILREMAMVHDDPDDFLFHAVLREAFREDLLRYPVIGDEKRFRELGLRDLGEFHEAFYRSGEAFWVLGGDLSEDAVNRAMAATPPAQGDSPGRGMIRGPVEVPKPVRLEREGPWGEGRGLALFLVPVSTPRSARMAEWAVETLAGGESGLLVRRLRNELQCVHHLDGFLYGLGPVALLGFSWMADSESLPRVEEEFFSILSDGGRGRLREEDLLRGWDRCRFQRLKSRQSVDGWVSQLGEEVLAFGRIASPGEDPIDGSPPGMDAWNDIVGGVLNPENCMAGFLKGADER